MDRNPPNGRLRMRGSVATRINDGDNNNNRNRRTVEAPLTNRRRVVVPHHSRHPAAHNGQQSIILSRPTVVNITPPPPPLENNTSQDRNRHVRANESVPVINLVTPPRNTNQSNTTTDTTRARHNNIIEGIELEVNDGDNDDDNVLYVSFAEPVDSEGDDDHDNVDDVYNDDDPQFMGVQVVGDDSDNDIHDIFDALQEEEHRESEQYLADRELARRLQLEDDLAIFQRHMPHRYNHIRHFGEIRNAQNGGQIAQRAQHTELQEQAAAIARRTMFEQVMARYAIANDARQRGLFLGGNALQTTNHSLLGLHFVDRDFDERDYELLLQLDEQLPNRHTADAKLVEKVPVKSVTADDNYDRCSICLCDMEEGEIRKELPCTHGFHKDCIDKWLKDYKGTCPVCKQSLSEMEGKLAEQRKKKKRKADKAPSSSSRRHKKRKVSDQNQ
jgi:hypothetical protein